MSAMCALVYRDGRLARPEALDPLLAAAPHRGGEWHCLTEGPSALGIQRQSAAPSQAATCQLPTADSPGAATIAFHGRIDNRSDLLDSLAQRWPEAVEDDDARLVLRAFIQWREGCAERLLGDFAFVVWDPARRLVYGARDGIGVKPFYYHLSPARFVAATELPQVLAAGVPLAPCESMVAEYLAFDVRTRTDTLYRDVCRLPPGHWMTVTERDVRVVQYWAPDATRELKCASDDEYSEQFFEVFRQSVSDRSPADRAVAAYLSGGLDSSSVVCMLQALGRGFETFSLLFPETPEADERPFIDAVSQRVGVRSHRLTVAPLDAGDYRRQARLRADLPELPSDAIGAPLLGAMRDRGLHVALTGVGGDHGFAGSLLHYADLLQARDFTGLVRQWQADRVTTDVGWTPGQVLSQGVRLLIPAALRRAARPVARQFGWGVVVPSWLEPAFAHRTQLLDRLNAPRGGSGPGLPTRRYICELFESGWTARLLEATDRSAAEYGVELRHPFYDRRVVEFAMAIPESQRWRGSTTKLVMRHAMRELLPESVYSSQGQSRCLGVHRASRRDTRRRIRAAGGRARIARVDSSRRSRRGLSTRPSAVRPR